MTIAAGTRLGRYEIRSLLGAGGMGEVYLAHDRKLDRTVALKILPAEVAQDQKRMQRFIQEAKAASALNHPNIITIHEVEQIDATHFIATEFIDGETLRQRLARGRMKLSEALDISMQVAAALAAAHAAGIVHRDIKPENIMLRRDGYAKVLDFGLAKLMERETGALDTEAPTQALVNTDPGTVMGTVAYMSPEQARGLEVDARTDIWSLGVTLYEMVAGRMPFEGATPSHIIVAITDKEPPLLARYAPDAPEALEWIITKALTKDPEERYQSAKEMLVDLRRLKQRLDISAEIERSAAPEEMSDTGTPTASGQQAPSATVSGSAFAPRTSEMETARTVSSAEYMVNEIKRHKTGALVALTLFVVVLAAASIAWYKLAGTRQATEYDRWATPLQAMRVTRITTAGKTWNAAISPDGRFIAYTVHDADQESLWLRQVATNSNAQIIPPAEAGASYGGLTFSPDGNYIYYAFYDRNTPQGALFQISVIGGSAPRRVLTNINSPLAFSPDGRQIAFLRFDPGQGEDSLMIANADGSGERRLAARRGDAWFEGAGGLAWSPDGRVIAAAGGTWTGGMHEAVIVVQVADGAQRELTSERWRNVGRVAWLRDGSGLIFTAQERESIFSQIWQVAYPSGQARRITNDLNDYGRVSLTADSSALVVTQGDVISNIWLAPGGEVSRARQIPSNRYDGLAGMTWTPDGRIVYTASAGNNPPDIWIMNADGTGQRQLTTDLHTDSDPAVSPDGRHIVFVSYQTGMPNLWLMEVDGSNQRQLTSGGEDYSPSFTPDGQWIVFASWDPGKQVIFKVSINGGDPIQLTDRFSFNPVVSPDGSTVACVFTDEQPGAPRIALLPIGGGQLTRILELPRTANFESVRWSADGRALFYLDTRGGHFNLWSQPIDGGAARQLTNFNDQTLRVIFRFDWSPDGRQLLLVRGTSMVDVVMISHPR